MMTTNVARVAKASLYPIGPSPETEALVDALVVFKNSDGSYDLAREITPAERRLIEARRNELVDNLSGCRSREIEDDVLQLLMGFGGGQQDAAVAATVAAQYAATLIGSPAWAVKRACGRWARGEVQPDEVGEKKLSRTFAPSAAQVKIVAEEVARRHRQELVRLNQTLKAAALPRPPTDEEREAARPKVKAMLDEMSRRSAESDLAASQERARIDAARARESREWLDERLRREWRALGVEPPVPLFSVAMARSLGCEIVLVGDRKTLVHPPPPKKSERDWQRDGSS